MKTFEINKILVPTDFSETSMKAINYATELAKRTGAEITLLNVVETSYASVNTSFESIPKRIDYEEEIIKASQEKLAELADSKTEAEFPPFQIQTALGRTNLEIIAKSKEIGASIIVMGTHGVSGFRELMVGSNAYRVVADADCPVLTIQSTLKNGLFHKILIPFNDRPHSREKVRYALQIAKIYGASVHILGIDEEGTQKDTYKIAKEAEQIKAVADSKGIPCTIEVVSENYYSNYLLNHAMETEADLIVEMRGMEKDNITEYFKESIEKSLVNHSPIPILTVKINFNPDTVNYHGYGW
jgi:nucleotide-binding universal stress UspA family protein